jgi:hypothetical protein
MQGPLQLLSLPVPHMTIHVLKRWKTCPLLNQNLQMGRSNRSFQMSSLSLRNNFMQLTKRFEGILSNIPCVNKGKQRDINM